MATATATATAPTFTAIVTSQAQPLPVAGGGESGGLHVASYTIIAFILLGIVIILGMAYIGVSFTHYRRARARGEDAESWLWWWNRRGRSGGRQIREPPAQGGSGDGDGGDGSSREFYNVVPIARDGVDGVEMDQKGVASTSVRYA